MFDNYVSLGINCESTYQLRRATGQPSANVFDWVLTPYPCLVDVIDHEFKDFFLRENLSLHPTGEYATDTRFGFQYHHFFAKDEGVITEESMERDFPQVSRRMARLVRRWWDMVGSEREVLYIVHDVTGAVHLAEMVALREQFQAKYPAHRCQFLWVRRTVDGDPGPFHAADRIMAAVAPPGEGAHFWKGDDAVWDGIYAQVWESVGGFRAPQPLP